MEKEKFVKPTIEINLFSDDVITSSGQNICPTYQKYELPQI